MNSKIQKLQVWGCNVNEAMKRMLDDEEFYLECLETVITDNNFEDLKVALQNGEIEKAFDCAHALKGVLANLSLTPMYNKIVEIVEPLRAKNGDNLLGKTDEVIEMRDYLKSIIEGE